MKNRILLVVLGVCFLMMSSCDSEVSTDVPERIKLKKTENFGNEKNNRIVNFYDLKNNLIREKYTSIRKGALGNNELVETTTHYIYNNGLLKNKIREVSTFDGRLDSIQTFFVYYSDEKLKERGVVNQNGDTTNLLKKEYETQGRYAVIKNLNIEKRIELSGKMSTDTNIRIIKKIIVDDLTREQHIFSSINGDEQFISSQYYSYNEGLVRELYRLNSDNDTVMSEIYEYVDGVISLKTRSYNETKMITNYDFNGCISKTITHDNFGSDTVYYDCDENCKILEYWW